MRSPQGPAQPFPNSLISGATAHTIRPKLESTGTVSERPRRSLSLGLLAVSAVSAALVVTGAATVSHIRPRVEPVVQIVSGTPVLKKSSDGDDVRWHSGKATLYLDASLDALGGQAREAVQMGFGTWLGSGAKVPSLSFDSTRGAKFGLTPNGKSEVTYGPITLPGHENDLALTITFSDPKTGDVLEADMIFNSAHPYGLLSGKGDENAKQSATVSASSCREKYDLQSVATHEAGHFFGLGEDYDAKSATMYYTTGRCEINKRALQSSDETTMDALYVQNASQTESASTEDPTNVTAKGCGGARIGQGSTSGAVPVLSLLGLLGFVAWRRRRG